MSYRKHHNKLSIWIEYCNLNQKIIEVLKLPDWVFLKEQNFRDFATTGQISRKNQDKFDFESMSDEVFWKLFDFINDYFDYDSTLFTKFEKSRLKR